MHTLTGLWLVVALTAGCSGGDDMPTCCHCLFAGASCSGEAVSRAENGDLGAPCEEVCAQAGVACPLQSAGECNGSIGGNDFVLIEAGSFTMGSPATELGRDANDETEHEVTLTSDFLLQSQEVSQGQWQFLMVNNPSTFSTCGDRCPVDNVSWWDALAYANALSELEGLAACYTLSGCTGTAGEGLTCSGVTVNAPGSNPYSCTGYRLPTEAEWEYAYRAGTTTAFYNGGITQTACNLDPNLDAIGWYCGNTAATNAVAQKAANPWGLYDMSGNVYDWCWDWYGLYPGAETDPTGAGTGSRRVLRGGASGSQTEWSRAAWRHAWEPEMPAAPFGIRLARSAP